MPNLLVLVVVFPSFLLALPSPKALPMRPVTSGHIPDAFPRASFPSLQSVRLTPTLTFTGGLISAKLLADNIKDLAGNIKM